MRATNLTKGTHIEQHRPHSQREYQEDYLPHSRRKGDAGSPFGMLYQVETKVLNRAVKRNLQRFPSDFMFQLTAVDADFLGAKLAPQTKAEVAGVTCHTFSLSKA
jgi:ORF6N domain